MNPIIKKHLINGHKYLIAADRWFDKGEIDLGFQALSNSAACFANAADCIERLVEVPQL
jgi:hypothetical protein